MGYSRLNVAWVDSGVVYEQLHFRCGHRRFAFTGVLDAGDLPFGPAIGGI